jgi:CRISPR-associated endonuclease/helicase Cas3
MLVVVNTIHSAVELYTLLRESSTFHPFHEFQQDKFAGEQPLVHLSTNITPWQRQQRVTFLRDFMQGGGKPLVISTQVVEAGVDLDFDVVIRDQGPLDSIVQVAGRCNRNGTKGDSKAVYVVNLAREHGNNDATLVYGKILPDISNRILTNVIKEPELYETVDNYFAAMAGRLNEDKSHNFVKAVDKLHFHFADESLSVSQYNLIDEYEHEPVIVELSKDAKEAVDKLEQLYKYGGDKHAFRQAYRDLGAYIITPSKYRIKKNLPPRYPHPKLEEHFYLPYAEVHADHPNYYNLETGFKWQDEATIF